MMSIRKDRVKPTYTDLKFLKGLPAGTDIVQYKAYWENKNNFYYSRDSHTVMLELLGREFPECLPAIIRKAKRISDLKIPVFGHEITFNGSISWQKDPQTGDQWPCDHWSLIPVVGGIFPMDAKWVWELNRHQFLLPVAIAYWATRSENYARFIIDVITDWIKCNRVGEGINWVESQEVALRITTWLWVLELIKGASGVTAEHLDTILNSIIQQAAHIHRYPSFYISPNTHLTGEAFGLFLFGCLYPEYEQSADWAEFGQSVLEQELVNQFEASGIHSELSTYYHCYSIEYYVQFALLAAKNNIQLTPDIFSRISKMYDFLMHVARPDGSLPMMGDGDGGRSLPLVEESYGDVRSLLGIGGFLLDRPDLCRSATGALAENIWLFGADFPTKHLLLSAGVDTVDTPVYEGASLMIYRFGHKGKSHHIVLNGGKMGFLSAGHSHADYLHVELSLFGVSFLSDRGTFSYKDEYWRNYTRSTAAHNTVTVDGQDQVRFRGPFGWQELPAEAKTAFIRARDYCLLEGTHGCYPEISHKRAVLVISDTFILLTDHFCAEKEHHYKYHYHLAPDISIAKLSTSVVELAHSSGVRAWFDFDVVGSAQLKTTKGGDGKPRGYHFPRYGNKQKAGSIEIEESVTGEVIRTTLIIPKDRPFETVRPKVLRSVGDGYVELQLMYLKKRIIYNYFLAAPSIFRADCYLVCCNHSISLWDDENLEELALFQVTRFEYNEQPVFCSTDPVDSIVMLKVDGIWIIETPHNVIELLCKSLDEVRVEHIRREA